MSAPEPAQAHVALLFGDELQWEAFLPVPAAGNLVEATFHASRAVAPDEPIKLHLHNHGGNTYLVVSLEGRLP